MEIALNTIALEPARWDKYKSRALPLERIIPAIARAGYPACEVWQHHITNRSSEDVPDFAALGRRHGVRFAVVGAYPLLHLEGAERDAETARLNRLMDACEGLGAPVLKIFPGRIGTEKITPDERGRSIAFLGEMLGRASDRGLTVTAETHAHTLADSPEAALALVRELDAGNFGLCYQPFGSDTASAIAAYDLLKDEVAHVHLQARDENGFCLMSECPLDHRAYLGRVRESGFDGILSVEFVRDCHPKDRADYSEDKVVASAAADLAFIREVWSA